MEELRKLYDKNKQSLQSINRNNPDDGIEIIKEVQKRVGQLRKINPSLKQQLDSVQIISLNNLACAYNKKNKLKMSLIYLQKARELQQQTFKDIESTTNAEAIHQVATTYSNICAVLSRMGEHEKALDEINKAIALLNRNQQTKKSDALIILYFNAATELQYLHRLNEAKSIAEKGHALSQNNKEMQNNFLSIIINIKEKMKDREKKITRMMMKHYRSKSKESLQKKMNLTGRGNSLTTIYNKNVPNVEYQSQYLPETLSPRKRGMSMRLTEYPHVRLPSFTENREHERNSKLTMFGYQKQRKILSLYRPTDKNESQNKRLKLNINRNKISEKKLNFLSQLL